MEIIRLEFIRGYMKCEFSKRLEDMPQMYSFRFILSNGYSIITSCISNETNSFKKWTYNKISTLKFNYFYVCKLEVEDEKMRHYTLQKEKIFPHQGFIFSNEQIEALKTACIIITTIEEVDFTEDLRILLLDISKLFS